MRLRSSGQRLCGPFGSEQTLQPDLHPEGDPVRRHRHKGELEAERAEHGRREDVQKSEHRPALISRVVVLSR